MKSCNEAQHRKICCASFTNFFRKRFILLRKKKNLLRNVLKTFKPAIATDLTGFQNLSGLDDEIGTPSPERWGLQQPRKGFGTLSGLMKRIKKEKYEGKL